MSDARNLGETALRGVRGQPSAEIVRVGCAKPRRNCDCIFALSTLCGDRARNLGETAFVRERGQPSDCACRMRET